MGVSVALLPAQTNQHLASCSDVMMNRSKPTLLPRRKHSFSPTARLFGPAIFEASKLKVLFLRPADTKRQYLPRTYTLTHSDITSNITLAISHTVNTAQIEGWYSKLQRDEVVAEWKKVKGETSLHVHCHISGGHFLLDFIAGLRYYIFAKELPVVLNAFVHGDMALFERHPELMEAPVWVYFHSNLAEFNRVECWGPLADAATGGRRSEESSSSLVRLDQCKECCKCCFPSHGLLPWEGVEEEEGRSPAGQPQQ